MIKFSGPFNCDKQTVVKFRHPFSFSDTFEDSKIAFWINGSKAIHIPSPIHTPLPRVPADTEVLHFS